MIIAGAGGHALEVLDALLAAGGAGAVYLFDDHWPAEKEALVWGRFEVLRAEVQLAEVLRRHPAFALGTGSPQLRHRFAARFAALGGVLTSVVSPLATISSWDVALGPGVNIMPRAHLSVGVRVGEGALINTAAVITHDAMVGRYAEICPSVTLCGGAQVGDFAFIGTGATVLPGVRVGAHARVGAGAVVTADVAEGATVVGVPARVVPGS